MNHGSPVMALTIAMGFALSQPQVQTPRPNADPYANNADPGTTQFPWQRPPARIPAPSDRAPRRRQSGA